MSDASVPRLLTFAGLPLASWAFALRVWIAVVAALYAAFWLQLEAASSAAVCVGILAFPTRGQAFEKAGFRFLATVIGVAVSIVLVGAFSQTRDLLLLAFAAWVGLCVYGAYVLDGNRAYAAVLSGYTVAIVAIQEIDAPQHLFETGIARGAAITVGIAVIAVVNDLLAAPDRHVGLAGQLANLHGRVRDFARTVTRGQPADPVSTAGLLREIAALRSEIPSLAAESGSGWNRSAAARSAAVALVAEVHAAHVLAAAPVAGGAALREWASRAVSRRDREAADALAALASGTRPAQAWRTPLYRCHRFAVEAGIRAALWLAMASAVFVLGGWSATAISLTQVAVVIGLGATAPDPRRFTLMALIAGLIAALCAGVLEFPMLDGATQFPLLALGLAPFIVGSALLLASPNAAASAAGRLILINVLVILGPSNPPSYNPETFLDVSLFVSLAAVLMVAAQILIPPVSDERRRSLDDRFGAPRARAPAVARTRALRAGRGDVSRRRAHRPDRSVGRPGRAAEGSPRAVRPSRHHPAARAGRPMTYPFYELMVGDVLLAPFVRYAVAALAIFMVLRPVLHLIGFSRLFSHPPIAELSLYVTILGLLTVFV